MSTVKTPKYKIGDKVKLNVGGPDMAVKSISTNHNDKFIGMYKCQWFAGKKLEWGEFPEDSLELITVSEEAQSKK
ncbi:DUF2158 domain-containing protein [Acinetobacter sp. KU 011TH]|nr:DUF2158 domain-containing protein [Acinetobacter sp. KU 011TH]TDM62613.1 DUF2158 domain-containing protein [Acinetobacter sp. KU 013TH]